MVYRAMVGNSVPLGVMLTDCGWAVSGWVVDSALLRLLGQESANMP